MQNDLLRVRQAGERDLDIIMMLYTHLLDNDEKAGAPALKKAWQEIFSDPGDSFFYPRYKRCACFHVRTDYYPESYAGCTSVWIH